jgi:hypothetical protein
MLHYVTCKGNAHVIFHSQHVGVLTACAELSSHQVNFEEQELFVQLETP